MNQKQIKIPPWVALEAEILICKKLSSTEKVLYGIIAAICNSPEKKCYSQNRYFGNILDITPREVQYCIKKLEKLGFIKINFVDGKRIITTVINSFLEYRERKLLENHQEYLNIADYDWLMDPGE